MMSLRSAWSHARFVVHCLLCTCYARRASGMCCSGRVTPLDAEKEKKKYVVVFVLYVCVCSGRWYSAAELLAVPTLPSPDLGYFELGEMPCQSYLYIYSRACFFFCFFVRACVGFHLCLFVCRSVCLPVLGVSGRAFPRK